MENCIGELNDIYLSIPFQQGHKLYLRVKHSQSECLIHLFGVNRDSSACSFLDAGDNSEIYQPHIERDLLTTTLSLWITCIRSALKEMSRRGKLDVLLRVIVAFRGSQYQPSRLEIT